MVQPQYISVQMHIQLFIINTKNLLICISISLVFSSAKCRLCVPKISKFAIQWFNANKACPLFLYHAHGGQIAFFTL